MSSPLVSIIMPTWASAQYISDAIMSVLSQTYQNWELLIQDDCSTDSTADVVAAFAKTDSRIKYECNPVNSGAAVSRNNALKRAVGIWIAFLDSDDLWEPRKLEKQLAFMSSNKCSFSYTAYKEINEEGKDTGVFVSGPKKITKYGMYAFCWLGCLTVMYNREVVGDVQIEDLKKNNDYAIWLKICKKADCFLLDEPLAFYRRGCKGSISSCGYTTLVKWHYRLWRHAEKMNPFAAFFWTAVNVLFGVFKKVWFVSRCY